MLPSRNILERDKMEIRDIAVGVETKWLDLRYILGVEAMDLVGEERQKILG